MGLMDEIKQKARTDKKRVVLPEGPEERTLKAAEIISREGIADVILIGNEAEISEKAAGLDISRVTIIDSKKSDKLDDYAAAFYELRKHKGVTQELAKETIMDPLYYACMMIKMGDADGMVAGAINTTANTLRPALQIIKTSPGISVVSSSFIMELENKNYGHNGILMFGDCAINPCPDENELAAIAVSTAKTGAALTGMTPKVAMLSFSTKGSAKHALADKVIRATEIVKQLDPSLMVDGELQADAALVEKVGQLKSPGSPVAGKANVLIFPDLQAGNIGYKLVQRLAGAEAIGPISQGLAAPVNDLSRGCSVDDIVSVVAITAVQAQN
ncbi:MAG: phosphate acetyltransferase [Eubacteriales bacterium]|nr:phosphate acetyltransferase [Eubacteriales bacterium]